jgi:hypothetical protein
MRRTLPLPAKTAKDDENRCPETDKGTDTGTEPDMKFIHLHIPKTAGTSLRESLQLAHPDLKVLHAGEPVPTPLPAGTDVLSGHFSHAEAIAHGTPEQIVTVLRHPVDRFVSIYFFWRELYAKGIEQTRKTTLAHALPLREFALALDEPELASELFNRMSWQLHSSFRLMNRFEMRRATGLTLDALAQGALDNLRRYAVVGFQDSYGDFVGALNDRFGLAIQNRKINVTARRSAMEDLSHGELSAILPWIAADMQVYRAARAEFG